MKFKKRYVPAFMVCLILKCFFIFTAIAGGLPEGFVYVGEIIPDVVVELRYHTRDNFVGRPVDGYGESRCIVSREAAKALCGVQADLKQFGLGLKIFDAYRPQRAVDHFVRWARDVRDTKMKAKYYPHVDKKDLFRKKYIAEKSSHSRGGAVDVTIVDMDPKKDFGELDMGSGFDFFSPKSWPEDLSIGPSQRAHRMLLRFVMVKNGFAPYPEEWWHFTLKKEPFPDMYFDFPIKQNLLDEKTGGKMIHVFPGIEGLIFDCDGTLADTMTIHTEAWRETLKKYGRDCPVEFLTSLRGMPAKEIVVRFNQCFGAELNPKEVADAKNRMTHERLKFSKPIDPVARIAIDYRNKLPMAVVSGGTRENVLRTLKAIRMSDFFEPVITADDGLKSKPDPHMFIEAAKRMNVDPKQCQVFEDGDLGLQAARIAGMRAVDVRPYVS